MINAAYLHTQFWDGREPTLEAQSAGPFIKPVEMALPSHEPILKIVRADPDYVDLFKKAFGKTGVQVTMKEVEQAIASFERTVVAGNSPFDRYYFGGDKKAMSPAAIRGLDIFINQGRCVSCHVIEQTTALFTDNRFHMIGDSANQMPKNLDELAAAVEDVKKRGVAQQESEQVRVVTDGQGRVVFASKSSGSGSEARVTKVWHDGDKIYVRDAGGSGGKAKTIEIPANRILAVDASLLILLRFFPFETDQQWEVFMVDFSGFSTTVTVRQAAVETVATPAGAFECYRMEVVVGVPISQAQDHVLDHEGRPHFLVSHQGKRGPFTSSYVTTLISVDSGLPCLTPP